MKKELPITFKGISLLLFIILVTSGWHYLMLETNNLKKEPVEDTVTLKYSKKGMYLYPRYEVLVEGSEAPAMVSKEQFERLEEGDTITGFKRNEDTLLTKENINNEMMIGIPILVFLYFVLFMWVIGLLNSTNFVKRRSKLSHMMKRAFKITVTGILTIYLLAGLIMTSLIAVNVFHKLNKFNLTETNATVLGGDWNRIRSNRGGSYTTYELMLLYSTDEDQVHITKKAVTRATYNAYDQADTLTIFYRNNNEYDTFVKAESIEETIFAFVNVFTIIIGGYLVSVFYLIRHWRKKRQKKQEQEEGMEVHL